MAPKLQLISIMSVDLSPLFDGGFFRVQSRDESLFLAGTPVHSMFLVTEGQVDLIRYTQSGLRILLYRAEAGDVLAEASAYSETYHCDGTAAGPAQVRSVGATLPSTAENSAILMACRSYTRTQTPST